MIKQTTLLNFLDENNPSVIILPQKKWNGITSIFIERRIIRIWHYLVEAHDLYYIAKIDYDIKYLLDSSKEEVIITHNIYLLPWGGKWNKYTIGSLKLE